MVLKSYSHLQEEPCDTISVVKFNYKLHHHLLKHAFISFHTHPQAHLFQPHSRSNTRRGRFRWLGRVYIRSCSSLHSKQDLPLRLASRRHNIHSRGSRGRAWAASPAALHMSKPINCTYSIEWEENSWTLLQRETSENHRRSTYHEDKRRLCTPRHGIVLESDWFPFVYTIFDFMLSFKVDKGNGSQPSMQFLNKSYDIVPAQTERQCTVKWD